MNCPHCGASVDEKATVCESCNLAIGEPPKEEPTGKRFSWIWIAAIMVVAAAVVVFFLLRGTTPSAPAPNATPTNTSAAGEQGEVIVANVNGETVKKSEFENQFIQLVQLYAQIGLNVSDPTQLQSVREQVMDGLVQNLVLKQQVQKQGVTLTAEEEREVLDKLDADLESFREGFRATAEQQKAQDATVDVEKVIDELMAQEFEAMGLSAELIRQDRLEARLIEKLQLQVQSQATVSDSEIKEWYDAKLPEQKQTYADNPAQYGIDVESNTPALFVPEGYSRVKHILIKPALAYPETELSDLLQERTDWAEEYKQMLLNQEGTSEEREALVKKIDESIAKSKALVDGWYSSIKPKADEALEKVKAGGDFDALMAEYGEDPGMKAEPEKTLGYLFNKDTSFVEPFKEAALALKNVGDTTGLVETEHGYHIIKLVARLESAEVPLDEVKDAIYKVIESQKGQTLWNESVEKWTNESKIETFYERVADVTY